MAARTLRLGSVNLCYEVAGTGPLLLCIAGGSTDAAVFTSLAEVLRTRYTVVTYDPRGNSRSRASGPPGDLSIGQLADDARALLQAVGGGPARVFGSSSGAITGIDLLTRYPDMVHHLIAHEPPMFSVLPEAAHWNDQLQAVTRTAARLGTSSGMQQFAAAMGLGAHPSAPPHAVETRSEPAHTPVDNDALFLTHGLLPFTRYRPQLSTLIRLKSRLTLGVGVASSHLPPAQSAHWLAHTLGVPLRTFPGDHVGYAWIPAAFATALEQSFASAG